MATAAVVSRTTPRHSAPQKSIAPTPEDLLTKSQSRCSTLVRKRDEAEMDGKLSDLPSSPSKRAKVAFNEEVEVNIVGTWEKAPELIREEVKRAITDHVRGDDEDYRSIITLFTENEAGPGYVAALIPQASKLGRTFSGLVNALLNSDWIHRNDIYVDLFIRLLGSIVSAQGVWLSDALRMLVKKFTVNATNLEDPATKSKAQSRVHLTLRYLLRLVPTASQVLSNALNALFPHPSDSKRTHIKYVRALLKIVDYAPELQSEILELITERAVKIDVEIQGDLEDLAEELEDGIVQNLTEKQTNPNNNFNPDNSDSEENDDSEEEDPDEDADPETLRARKIHTSVQNLDSVMDLLFSYYATLISSPTHSLFASSTLLANFSTTILPTYRSRHTQFLHFHFFQTTPELVDSFVGTCLHLTFDRVRPAHVRSAAAAYLASFVARGRRVSAQIARDVFAYLGARISDLRAEHESLCRGPDPRRYATFYALAQALLYIFCFRWRDFLVGSDDESEAERLSPPGLPRAIDGARLGGAHEEETYVFVPGVKDVLWSVAHSRINPLRVCAPAIVAEFARLTERLQLLYVYSILEANKRVRLLHGNFDTKSGNIVNRQTALSARTDEEYLRLDAYFPFDPYRLPKSRRWVDGDYREWVGLDDGEDDDDEDGDEGNMGDSEEESDEA